MRDEQTGRVRRQPEGTVLYPAVQAAWSTLASRVSSAGRSVPCFREGEFAGFLRCGILGYGFARVHCDDCGEDDVVAFSCKGRGLCPSCGAARMVDKAAWLRNAVIPEVPVRQWVLSLPYRVRALCAHDAAACALVRSVLARAVSGFYERTAARAGVLRPRAGAVAFVQRFDSGLRFQRDAIAGWALTEEQVRMPFSLVTALRCDYLLAPLPTAVAASPRHPEVAGHRGQPAAEPSTHCRRLRLPPHPGLLRQIARERAVAEQFSPQTAQPVPVLHEC